MTVILKRRAGIDWSSSDVASLVGMGGKQEHDKDAWDINMADISTSQSDSSKFTAWSNGARLSVQAAVVASESGMEVEGTGTQAEPVQQSH